MSLGTTKGAQLSMAIGIAITKFTAQTPMTIGDMIDALCFTAGHAIPQKDALASVPGMDIRRLREQAIAALERGIEEGRKDRTKPQLFVPQGRSPH